MGVVSMQLPLTLHTYIHTYIHTYLDTGGSDFEGGEFIITLGTEEGATSCAVITINDDSTFEDVEDFLVILVMDPEFPSVQGGSTNTTIIRIDDTGELLDLFSHTKRN